VVSLALQSPKAVCKGVGYGALMTGYMIETPTPKQSNVARNTMFFFSVVHCAHFTGCEKAKEREE